MLKIVLASNNKKKILELETLLNLSSSNTQTQAVQKDKIEVFSLRDIGFDGDIVEDGMSFEENSLIKSAVPAKLGYIGIADDSGLAVDYLNGAPGIYSARYAGEHGDDAKNRRKLICELDGVPMESRGGKFVCAVSVTIPDELDITIPAKYRISEELAKRLGVRPEKAAVIVGECKGIILTEEHGEGGFGYDSLFMYPEFNKTFAEISSEEKNSVSHRGLAMKQLIPLLKELAEQIKKNQNGAEGFDKQ